MTHPAADAQHFSESRFRGLLDGAPDAIVISDGDGRIVLFNAEAERLFGYERNELIGQSVDVLMPERLRGRHAGYLRAYLARPAIRRMGDGDNMFGRRKDGSEFPIETNLSLLPDHGDPLITSVIRDLTPRREAQERQALLVRELNHRVKNTLASVQSIIVQTLRSAPTPEAFSDAVQARILALSQSHDVLTRNDWVGARVADIVKEQLRPYAREDAPVTAEGPDVMLRPNRAVTLGMVLGELATNAAKFGALSPAGGALSVTWSVEAPKAPRLRLVWRESGGAASPPDREGFGTRLVKRSLAAGLHGTARLEHAAEGLTAMLEFPLLGGEA
jgi:PAS domain S-box-containing protein